MAPVTYQTIKLSKSKRDSQDDGACVMELASMLAGEPFSDHPGSACPVIGSLLRAYNDSIDDDRRRDLYGFAAKVVDNRDSLAVEREPIVGRRGLRLQSVNAEGVRCFPNPCARVESRGVRRRCSGYWPSVSLPGHR